MHASRSFVIVAVAFVVGCSSGAVGDAPAADAAVDDTRASDSGSDARSSSDAPSIDTETTPDAPTADAAIPSDGKGERAMRTRDLLDGVGVNTHIDFGWTAYGDAKRITDSIDYLGVRMLRDSPGKDADVGTSGAWQKIVDGSGAKKILAFVGETSVADMSVQLGRMKSLAAQGILLGIEGGNEEDDAYPKSLGNDLAAASDFQKTSVAPAAKSLALPAFDISFGLVPDYGTTGDLSAYADYGNAHTYFGSGNPPNIGGDWAGKHHLGVVDWINALALETTPSKPVAITETGNITSTTGSRAVTEATQAKYLLETLMGAAHFGNPYVFVYELLDQKTGDANDENNFGLFHSDGTAKPAATAMKNLLALLDDASAAGGTFAPGMLDFSVSGMTIDGFSGNAYGGRHVLFQKGDGTFWIAIWNEQHVSTSPTTDATIATIHCTLSLATKASRVDVFDPIVDPKAITSARDATSIAIDVPDHPILVAITRS